MTFLGGGPRRRVNGRERLCKSARCIDVKTVDPASRPRRDSNPPSPGYRPGAAPPLPGWRMWCPRAGFEPATSASEGGAPSADFRDPARAVSWRRESNPNPSAYRAAARTSELRQALRSRRESNPSHPVNSRAASPEAHQEAYARRESHPHLARDVGPVALLLSYARGANGGRGAPPSPAGRAGVLLLQNYAPRNQISVVARASRRERAPGLADSRCGRCDPERIRTDV